MPTPTPTAKTTAQLAEEARAEEARLAHNAGRRRELLKLIRSIPQGDWLAICRALDLSRDTISDDENLIMLAAAWVKDKREHGAASVDVLLELTDRGLLEFHGYRLRDVEEDEEDDVEGDGTT